MRKSLSLLFAAGMLLICSIANALTIPGNLTVVGNINSTENATADYFLGNGSLLTGISASGMNDTEYAYLMASQLLEAISNLRDNTKGWKHFGNLWIDGYANNTAINNYTNTTYNATTDLVALNVTAAANVVLGLSGASVWASDVYAANDEDKTCDGDTGTQFYSQDGIAYPHYVAWNLSTGVTKTVTKMCIYWHSGYNVNAYNISGSNDNNTWTEIKAGNLAGPGAGWENTTFTNTNAYQYYKFNAISSFNASTYFSAYEIELWTSATSSNNGTVSSINFTMPGAPTKLGAVVVLNGTDVANFTVGLSRNGTAFTNASYLNASGSAGQYMTELVDVSAQGAGNTTRINVYANNATNTSVLAWGMYPR